MFTLISLLLLILYVFLLQQRKVIRRRTSDRIRPLKKRRLSEPESKRSAPASVSSRVTRSRPAGGQQEEKEVSSKDEAHDSPDDQDEEEEDDKESDDDYSDGSDDIVSHRIACAAISFWPDCFSGYSKEETCEEAKI